jgi:hypothetical protein
MFTAPVPFLVNSVADPGCLSIPDPGSNNSNKRGGENFYLLSVLFVAANFTKLKTILFLNRYRK